MHIYICVFYLCYTCIFSLLYKLVSFIVEEVCQDPNIPLNSTLLSINRYLNGIAHFACNAGFQHTNGSLQRECLSSGKWSGVAPVCTCKLFKIYKNHSRRNSGVCDYCFYQIDCICIWDNLHLQIFFYCCRLFLFYCRKLCIFSLKKKEYNLNNILFEMISSVVVL